jgi:hypothetical protein
MHRPGQEMGPKHRINIKSDRFLGDNRNLWFIALFATFMSLTLLMIIFFRHSPNVELFFSPMNLLLFALASYRLGRIVALDEVSQPLRVFFIQAQETQSGKEEVPRSSGLRGAIAALITSPDSVGFWISGFLVYGFILWPSGVRMIMIVLAVNGLGQIFNGLVQLLGNRAWQARQQSQQLEMEVNWQNEERQRTAARHGNGTFLRS